MDEWKWKELDMDCLVNVFERLGMDGLLLDVPFVCKSWYKASLSPLCWRRLVFPEIPDPSFMLRFMDEYRLEEYPSITGIIKVVVNRSDRSALSLRLPCSCTEEALIYVANGCPALKLLELPLDLLINHRFVIPNLVNKWENLERLRLGSSYNLQEILNQVGIHCKNCTELEIIRPYMGKDEASAIVDCLPNIKYLDVQHAYMERENLVMILQGCKQLVHFDARHCIGFEGDNEILKLASHIPTFKYEGSRFDDESDNNYDHERGRYYYDREEYYTIFGSDEEDSPREYLDRTDFYEEGGDGIVD